MGVFTRCTRVDGMLDKPTARVDAVVFIIHVQEIRMQQDWDERVWASINKGNTQEARKVVKTILAENQTCLHARAVSAILCLHEGKPQQAIEQSREVLQELRQRNAPMQCTFPVVINLMSALLDEGNALGAFYTAQAFQCTMDDNASLDLRCTWVERYAEVLIANNHHDKAEQLLVQHLECPDLDTVSRASAQHILGVLYSQKREYEQANAYLRQAIRNYNQQHVESIRANYVLARVLVETQDYTGAAYRYVNVVLRANDKVGDNILEAFVQTLEHVSVSDAQRYAKIVHRFFTKKGIDVTTLKPLVECSEVEIALRRSGMQGDQHWDLFAQNSGDRIKLLTAITLGGFNVHKVVHAFKEHGVCTEEMDRWIGLPMEKREMLLSLSEWTGEDDDVVCAWRDGFLGLHNTPVAEQDLLDCFAEAIHITDNSVARRFLELLMSTKNKKKPDLEYWTYELLKVYCVSSRDQAMDTFDQCRQLYDRIPKGNVVSDRVAMFASSIAKEFVVLFLCHQKRFREMILFIQQAIRGSDFRFLYKVLTQNLFSIVVAYIDFAFEKDKSDAETDQLLDKVLTSLMDRFLEAQDSEHVLRCVMKAAVYVKAIRQHYDRALNTQFRMLDKFPPTNPREMTIAMMELVMVTSGYVPVKLLCRIGVQMLHRWRLDDVTPGARLFQTTKSLLSGVTHASRKSPGTGETAVLAYLLDLSVLAETSRGQTTTIVPQVWAWIVRMLPKSPRSLFRCYQGWIAFTQQAFDEAVVYWETFGDNHDSPAELYAALASVSISRQQTKKAAGYVQLACQAIEDGRCGTGCFLEKILALYRDLECGTKLRKTLDRMSRLVIQHCSELPLQTLLQELSGYQHVK